MPIKATSTAIIKPTTTKKSVRGNSQFNLPISEKTVNAEAENSEGKDASGKTETKRFINAEMTVSSAFVIIRLSS